jgi:hypothetical protein
VAVVAVGTAVFIVVAVVAVVGDSGIVVVICGVWS